MPIRLTRQQKILFVSEMENLARDSTWFSGLILEGPTRWKGENEVYKWLKQGAGTPGKMNCWEAVLVAGVRAGIWEKAYVERAIARAEGLTKLAAYMARKGMPFPIGRYRAEETGLIVMFGDWGEHFALSCGDGEVVELDKFEKGRQSIGDVSSRSPYCNNPRVYVAAPPDLEEL